MRSHGFEPVTKIIMMAIVMVILMAVTMITIMVTIGFQWIVMVILLNVANVLICFLLSPYMFAPHNGQSKG